MAVQILSQSYGPRKPLIECTADSLSDLAGLVCAEGSKATVGGTEYVLDRVNGWVEPGSGGGGGGGSGVLVVGVTIDGNTATLDKTWQEIYDASQAGVVVMSGLPQNIAYLSGLYAGSIGDTIATPWVTEFTIMSQSEVHSTQFDASTADGYPVSTLS